VNKEGAIRFGMGAIKGVGAAAVEAIVEERKKNGNYTSIFDLTKRVDLRAANKKAFDGLAMAGGLDSFKNVHRAQYYQLDEKGVTFIERAIRYGNKFQENKNSAQISMFGETSEVQFPEPEIPEAKKWGMMEELSKEKELVGIYISGHPLDDFKTEIDYFCNASLTDFQNLAALDNKDLSIGAIVTNVEHRVSKNGKGWASFTLEDYSGSYEFRLFGEEYLKFRHFLMPNAFLYLKIFCRKHWNNEIRLTFGNVQLLQDVLEEYAKKITLNLQLSDINENYIQKLNILLQPFKGVKTLNFLVHDFDENLTLNLPSRTYKVHISNKLIEVLNKAQIFFKLN
jgi:DNA polymerase-3 subunit alpha